jgi:hypothetical protein
MLDEHVIEGRVVEPGWLSRTGWKLCFQEAMHKDHM